VLIIKWVFYFWAETYLCGDTLVVAFLIEVPGGALVIPKRGHVDIILNDTAGQQFSEIL